MMEWKKFKDEIPPINKRLLISYKVCSFVDSIPIAFTWFIGVVHRPYNEDKKYNPDYYFIFTEDKREMEVRPEEYFWMKIETPIFEG